MYLPVPLARASPGREEPVVGTYGALGAVVLGATLGVGVVVLVGMILPPGLVQGGSVRFVSDAFKVGASRSQSKGLPGTRMRCPPLAAVRGPRGRPRLY